MMKQKPEQYALVGNPVGHSLSPLMHNAAIEAMQIQARYGAFPVESAEEAVRIIREEDIRGASVTLPLKTAIMACLDEVDDDARAIGAANTIINNGRKLIGYNTDWLGLTLSLREHFDIRGKSFAILGAGGASRAAVFGIMKQGGVPVVLNRTPARGEAVARDLGCRFRPLSDLGNLQADCLINTTPVGMAPLHHETLVLRRELARFAWVMDTIYNPLHTRLLQEAEAAGCGAISGLSMFIHQGAEQIRLWTGMEPPVETMARVVTEELTRWKEKNTQSRKSEREKT